MSNEPSNLAPRDGTLLHRLVNRGCEFDFVQAIWLLERYAGTGVPVGHRGPAGRELFRFRPDTSMGFPSTDVRRIEACRESGLDSTFYRIDVTFMGLYGVSSPLPLHYAADIVRSVDRAGAAAETVGESPGAGDALPDEESRPTPVRDFLDLFHHRLLSLFFRACSKYRYDRVFGLEGRDEMTDYLHWFIGCPRSYTSSSLGLEPLRLLRYGGALTQHPKSAAMLEGLVADFWGTIPVQINQCVGRWVAIRIDDQCHAGVTNTTLGVDLTIGEEVYDLSGTFNVALGPMDWDTYLTFLPGETCHAQTRALVTLYCTDPLAFTLELKLNADQAPELRLSSTDDASRLGLTSWVRTGDVPATSVTFGESSSDVRGQHVGAGGNHHKHDPVEQVGP